MNRFILIKAAVGIALLSFGLQPVRPVVAADPLLPSAAFPFPYPLDRLPPPNRLEQSLKGFPLIAPPIVPVLTEGAEAPLELQQNTTVQAVTPESLPDIEFAPVPETPSTATVAEGTITQFLGVSIEGSTVYSDAELQSIVAPLIGKRAEVGKLYEAARIITDKYRKDGYFLSQALVPDQTISDGYYRIRVIEGYVSDVLIQGDVGYVESLVRRYLAKIPGNVPIKLATVERYLLLARDIPG
ncbi:MAG: hypothetical protein ORO03_08640, partial [Alphaproteobacteria bacterium]|nr:hypothetical protein [Alphaproteobacteria bacterium]